MKSHLNTLYVTTDGAYLARRGETVLVRVEKQTKLQLPVHTIESIVSLARVGVSPSLMKLAGERGIAISLCDGHGRFQARISGFTGGNVLLRREQYRRADDDARSAEVARAVVAGKIANGRQVLLRFGRDADANAPGRAEVARAADGLAASLRSLDAKPDLDRTRGIEGDAANVYFSVFDHLLTHQKDTFRFTSRNRRPPLDPVNCLLGFLYAVLAHDCRSALECVGLDPAVGFLHRDRPGRPGLALDLMEEFRPVLVDRLVMSLVNRGQVNAADFKTAENGAVTLTDAARRSVLVAWQKRKQSTIVHPFIGEKVTLGLVPHLQARLLARHLRGDLDAYPPFIWR